jgi:murein DD-endopeptidase MepM/ murein hydrolase activator NlpD
MIRRSLLFLLALILLPLTASAFDVSVSPENIQQGDAFLVRIQSDNGILPRGSMGTRDIFFHRISPGTFIAISSTGLEQAPGKYFLNINQGSVSKNISILVHSRKSRTITLSLPRSKVDLSPENEKRAQYEIAELREKWSYRSERMWKGRFSPPIDTHVTTGFGIIRIINGHKKSVHKGIDYKGKEGMPIKAINAGVVSLTDDQFFGGKTVMIDHGEGIFSIYMHLSTITVHEGQRVGKSDVVGLVGSTGRASGPHLHMTVKWSGMTIDPLSLFRLPIE